MIKEGMIVRYKKEYCTPDERKYLHLVKETTINPVTNEMTRFKIVTLNTNLFLPPCEVVDDYMIEETGFTLEEVTNN